MVENKYYNQIMSETSPIDVSLEDSKEGMFNMDSEGDTCKEERRDQHKSDKRRKVEVNSRDLCEAKRVKMKLHTRGEKEAREYLTPYSGLTRDKLTSEGNNTALLSEKRTS